MYNSLQFQDISLPAKEAFYPLLVMPQSPQFLLTSTLDHVSEDLPVVLHENGIIQYVVEAFLSLLKCLVLNSPSLKWLLCL